MSNPTPEFCPYKGLQPYTEADRDYFFGRERDREIIIANLYASSLTVLYGASGVGKSSVLLAGVVPTLKETPRVAVVVFRDWQNPQFQTALKTAVQQAVGQGFGKEVDAGEGLPFDEYLDQCLQEVRGQIFFVLDQFEEYFFYHPPSSAETGFDAELARAVNRQEIRANFLFAVREDGLSKLDRFQGRIPQLLANLLRLEHLDRKSASEAIRKPLEEYNRHLPADQTATTAPASAPVKAPVIIEDGLVEILLDQVKTGRVSLDPAGKGQTNFQPGDALAETRIETPFLQMVLTRLWNEEMAVQSRQLRLSTFTRLGGTENIARTHLDQEMKHLKESECVAAARLFRFLVTPSGTKIAQDPGALADWAEISKEETKAVLTRLSADMRILRRVNAPGQADRFEIFHDMLAPAILDWRARFTKDQTEAETERRLARERQRIFKLRMGIIGLVVLLFVMILLTSYALHLRDEAEAHELAANAISQLPVDPSLSLGLAVEAADLLNGSETDYALRKSLIESHLRAVMQGHDNEVVKTAFSPDGKLIATASFDRTAKIWAADTGKLLHTLEGHNGGVSSVAFAPDGKLIVTASFDGTAKIWNAETGKEVFTLTAPEQYINSASFSPDGNRVVTANGNNQAQVWDVHTGQLVATLAGHTGAVLSANFSHDGKSVVTASEDQTARVWTDNGGQQWQSRLLNGHGAEVSCAIFSPDDKHIVTTEMRRQDNLVRVWEVASGRLAYKLAGHRDAVVSADFSPDGKYVVTASYDKTARVWEVETGKAIAELREHQDRIRYAAFSSNGKFIVTTSDDGSAMVSEAITGQVIAVLRGHTGMVTNAAFSPDSKFVVTASQDKTARLWDVGSTTNVITLTGHKDFVSAVAFSPDSKYIATAGRDREAKVWDAATGNLLTSFQRHQDYINSVAFSPDGKFVVTASRDKTAQVWETLTGKSVFSLEGHKEYLKSAVFSPDGKFIVTASDDKTARVWEMATGKMTVELKGHNEFINSAAFSPNGQFVVTASDDKTARVWETATGKMIVELAGHTLSLTKASFSPNGKFIVTASRDETARVWDWRNNKTVIELRGHTDVINSAVFSPDSKFVVTSSGGKDRTARVWDVATGDKVTLRGHIGGVESAVFNPNGKVVVTASLDATVRLWSASTGQSLAILRGHSDEVSAALFGPDGKAIATASKDKTARVYACEACGNINDTLTLAKKRLELLQLTPLADGTKAFTSRRPWAIRRFENGTKTTGQTQ